MRMHQRILVLALVAVLQRPAQAGELWTWTNSAVGEGLGQVFDGGPPVTDSVDLQGTTASFLAFRATDGTRPGSLGAHASANGASRVAEFDQSMRVLVDFSASYAASLFPGGDRPGGRAEGTFTSIIEFVMPVDQLDWFYGLGITEDAGFDGASSVVVENVTQGTTLLTLTLEIGNDTVLTAHAGDLIRITSQMSGSGEAPGDLALDQGYSTLVDMIFTIPEPATFVLLALGAVVALRGKRR